MLGGAVWQHAVSSTDGDSAHAPGQPTVAAGRHAATDLSGTSVRFRTGPGLVTHRLAAQEWVGASCPVFNYMGIGHG